MSENFRTYLQYILDRYGIDLEPIDFHKVSDFASLWNQLQDCHVNLIDINCLLKVVFDLHEKGIHLYTADYKAADQYLLEKDKWVIDEKAGVLSRENYIERFLLEDTIYKAIYMDKSVYTMGSPHLPKKDEYSKKAFAKELIKRSPLYQDILPNEIDQKTKEIINNIYYKQGGTIDRLKTYLNFDFKSYDPEKYKLQLYKILYFIYEMEYDVLPKLLEDGSRFNLLKFLHTFSIENVDNSVLEQEAYIWNTYRSTVIQLIKNTLAKEIPLSVVDQIWLAHDHVVKEWDGLFAYVVLHMQTDALSWSWADSMDAVSRILEFARGDAQKFYANHTDQFSPIAMLYFKVCQCELMGELRDSIKISGMKTDANYDVPSDLIWRMERLHSEKIDLDYIANHIAENADLLIEYVYLCKATDSEDKQNKVRKIRNSRNQVALLIEHFISRRPLLEVKDEITTLYIISCLQAILTDKNDVFFDLDVYGIKDRESPKVSGAFRKSDEYTIGARIQYWEQKVSDHWYANLGRYDMKCNYKKFDSICREITLEIYKSQSISEMLNLQQTCCELLGKSFPGFKLKAKLS